MRRRVKSDPLAGLGRYVLVVALALVGAFVAGVVLAAIGVEGLAPYAIAIALIVVIAAAAAVGPSLTGRPTLKRDRAREVA